MDQKIKIKIEKWQKEIEEVVDEICDIGDRKYVFEKQREIIKSNSKLQENNIFITYLFKNYAEAQILAILRMVENNGQTKSLVALLNDLLENFEEVVMSGNLRDKMIKEINEMNMDDMSKQHFINERGRSLFLWEKINSDKFELLKETAKLKIFRDKWVAHSDKKRPHIVIQYDELNQIIEFINSKTKEYSIFLTGSSLDQFHAINLEDDLEIFNFPWVNNS